MNNYKCKCGNEKDFFTEHNLSQCGLYCGECGKCGRKFNDYGIMVDDGGTTPDEGEEYDLE